ncbi:alpha/beta hydrolase [Rhodococcus sovatensis]|uniref:Alpha/beta hydrolase n=1 Tax=Rhodococcus sovatensis TaxID=1805840 RepID=A0ABZ2PJE9_9NOCA
MVSWSEIQQWNPSEVSQLGHRVSDTARDLRLGGDALQSITRELVWRGEASDAARNAIARAWEQYRDSARTLVRVGRCLADVADDMYRVRSAVLDCESTSVEHELEIDVDGAVSDGIMLYATSSEDAWETARSRARLCRDLAERVTEVIRRATEIDRNTTADLARIGDGVPIEPATLTVHDRTVQDHTAPANAAFWELLPQSDRTSLLVNDPGTIGNLDGIPADVRDAANRRVLVRERARLHDVADELSRRLDSTLFGGLLNNADAGLAQTKKRLEALDAISTVLDQGNRQLLVLDNSSAEDTLAAIAVGNVHTATHVAVFVPGLDSDVSGDMQRYDGDMESLEQNVRELVSPGESVACVTWMDYQAPQLGWSLLDPKTTVLSSAAAAVGSARLSSFLDGLDASRAEDPHLTLLGHSYGSLTAALALRGIDDTGVDEMIAVGSPGLGFDDVSRLSIPPGHLFVAETRDDLVADTGLFGGDPSELDGVRPVATRSPDGTLTNSHGHSEYLSDGTVTQRTIALVVSGRTDEVS